MEGVIKFSTNTFLKGSSSFENGPVYIATEEGSIPKFEQWLW